MPLQLYNTLTRKLEPFIPADPGHVTFYSCGPTVYDDAHIGNFRSFLAADLLRRWIESPLCELSDGKGGIHKGPRKVTHVMNITDVGHMTDDAEGGEAGEDRMAVAGRRLLEAKKAGQLPAGVEINPGDPYQIARFYEERFKEDARKLGLKISIEDQQDPKAGLHPRATENVPGMIAVVKRLISMGFAYVAGTPGSRAVYFSVQRFSRYGSLSGNTLDKLREGAGGRVTGDNQSQKQHPADFLLWKEDPSHIMKWESPWGWGYPGWHIECTVMSVHRLLLPGSSLELLSEWASASTQGLIDLHSGGEDNIFPHHECEIAQSCCAFHWKDVLPTEGASFARMWFHPRFLLVEGDKMSKSKGNFFTARDLFAKGIEPAALRLELIKTHYRSNANFTMRGLADSQRMVERWRRVWEAGSLAVGDSPSAERCVNAFATAMHDDLNVAAAIAAVNSFVGEIDAPRARDKAVMNLIDGILSVFALPRLVATSTEIGVFVAGAMPNPDVESKLRQRREARAAKDFKTSDAIRDELAAMGYQIKDVAGGKVEVSRKV